MRKDGIFNSLQDCATQGLIFRLAGERILSHKAQSLSALSCISTVPELGKERKNNIGNEVIVARNGVETLDYLFCIGAYSDRDLTSMPELILLDLRLPKVDGVEVLRQIRKNDRTRSLPVIVLTSSNADHDLVDSYA